MRSRGQSAYQPALAVVLASLIAALPLMAQAPAGHPAAGQITALIPAVQRNDRSVKIKEEINWQDVLRTDRAGRARLSLRDGSILSLGSYSELTVVRHDPNGQETLLQLNFGRVRSRVVAINRPDGRFEVQTPAAVLNVLGTDFFTQYDPSTNDLRVICYSGTVKVSGLGRFEGKSEIIHAGQMLEVSSSAFGAPQATLNAVQQDSIAETTLEGGPVNADSHLLRNVLIGAAAAAAGIVVGVLEGNGTFSGAGSSTTSSSPSSSGAKRPQP
jgi:ferric-dicitrate binding protein FerR (iron transport regulator)